MNAATGCSILRGFLAAQTLACDRFSISLGECLPHGDTPDTNVFILGAGFSADAGAPLLNDFLDTAREIFDAPDSALDGEEREQFEKVFEFKRHVAQAREKFRIDLDNIEELFGLIEMSHRLDSKNSAVRDAMVYVIAKTLQLAVDRKHRKPSIQLGPPTPGIHVPWMDLFGQHEQVQPNVFQSDIYQYFAMLLRGSFDTPPKLASRSNIVITFNYDLVLDNALRKRGVEPDYGLENETELDLTPGNEMRISFLKLHGSTNWAVCPSCERVHTLRDAKFTNDPRDFRTRPCSQCHKAGLHFLLVPPSWDKSEYKKVMRPVWQKATEALKNARRICIIGYSMPEADTFFRFLLTLGLADNHQLYRLVVVDRVLSAPEPSLIEKRYRNMLETIFETRRFQFFGKGFADFLTNGASAALGRAETVKTRGIF